MLMNSDMVNEVFLIENINASEEEKRVLKTIGITEGKKMLILGKGYLEGSILVNVDNIVLQLNPHFLKAIEGSLISEKMKNR